MKFQLKFDNPEQAKEFADILRNANLQGLRIKQAYKEPEKGALDGVQELANVLEFAIASGAIPYTVNTIYKFLDMFQNHSSKNKKIASNERIENNRIQLERDKLKSQERLAALNAVLQLALKKEEEQKQIDENKDNDRS